MQGNKTNYGVIIARPLATTQISTTSPDLSTAVIETYGYKTANIHTQMTTCSQTSVVVYADVSCDKAVTWGQIATLNYFHVTTAASTLPTNEAVDNLGTHLRIRFRMINAGASATVAASAFVLLKT